MVGYLKRNLLRCTVTWM